jgi:Fic family protein
MYISTKQAAEKWNISERRVRILCSEGKVEGAFKVGRNWNIPQNSKKPADARLKNPDSKILVIAEKKKLLDVKRPLTEGELERLNEEFIVENTYNSNAIEGNTLTLRETELVLRGLTIDKKPLKDHLEAVGHRDAFYFVCDLVKQKTALTESVIKQINTLVLADKPQDRGIYRRVPVRIMGAVHTPPEPYLVNPEMERLIEEYNGSSKDLITRLALMHLKFEGIHPFIDGNGRTGRLIVNFELMKAGYPPIDIKFTDRKSYYDAFDAYYGKNDENEMLNLFADYLMERFDMYLNILK